MFRIHVLKIFFALKRSANGTFYRDNGVHNYKVSKYVRIIDIEFSVPRCLPKIQHRGRGKEREHVRRCLGFATALGLQGKTLLPAAANG